VLPASAFEHISACRALEAPARRAYLRLLFARLLGFRHPVFAPEAPTPRTVMFVCYGNIIRSAFAESLLRAELQRRDVRGIEVSSSGTGARSGRPADRRAIALAPEFGISLDHHRATRVTAELMDHCDAVFAMDFSNEANLAAQFPAALPKIMLLAPSPDDSGPLQIPDPYTGDQEAVRACYCALQRRIRWLADQIAQSQRARAYSGNVGG
jgi:protein-tyrosine phosphatase